MTLLAEYPVPGGRVLARLATPKGSAWAVVRPGTAVTYEAVTRREDVRGMLTVVPVEPTTAAEAAVMAADQAASGWTSGVQLALIKQLLAGVKPLDAIEAIEPMRSTAAEDPDLERGYFDEGCPGEQTQNGEVELYGCYKRKWGATENGQVHAGTESFAAATNVAHGWELSIVTVASSYGVAQMKEFNPLMGFTQGQCGSESMSLTAYGVTVSQSQALCPERFTTAILNEGRVYGVDWRGKQTNVNDARATQLLEVAGRPAKQPFMYKFHMDMQARPICPPPAYCGPPPGQPLPGAPGSGGPWEYDIPIDLGD